MCLENKSSKQEPAEWQKGKQTIKSKRTKRGPGSQCTELISQTYESLTLEQKYHSPGSWLWSPLVIMGAMKRPGNKATFIFLCEHRGPGPRRTLPCAGFEGEHGPWPRDWGASEWASTWLTSLESSEASAGARTASWDVDSWIQTRKGECPPRRHGDESSFALFSVLLLC